MNQKKLIEQLMGGLTQSEFAQKVGTDQTRISKYKNEVHVLTLKRLFMWCEKLGKKITLE